MPFVEFNDFYMEAKGLKNLTWLKAVRLSAKKLDLEYEDFY